jgi:hypothetical protein
VVFWSTGLSSLIADESPLAIFASFVLLTIVSMELKPTAKQAYPPKNAVEASDGIGMDPLSPTT